MGNYLALVNKQNRYSNEMVEGFKFIDVIANDNVETQVEARTYNAFNALCERMKEFGIKVSINSARRTPEDQTRVFLELEQEYGTEYAKAHTALPYYSEHHTGLAIDVRLERERPNILTKLRIGAKEDKAKMYAIFHNQLADFGFIERYTQEKQIITGYPAERWHIRFVGQEYARQIKQSGLCLEEFLKEKSKDEVA